MMTKQEIFTKVRKHLLSQGKQAMRGSCCGYRGNDGTSCAAGCLIPDEEYHEGLEFHSVMSVHVAAVLEPIVGEANMGLVRDLQVIHDTRFSRDWAGELNTLANQYGLHTED